MLSYFDNFDHNTLYYSPLVLDLFSLFDRVIRAIFDRKIQAGQIDQETFLEASKSMFSEIESGFGSKLETASFEDGTRQLLQKMRRNTFTFIAFKNHSNITKMVDALKDDKGNLRTWSKFRQAADLINKQYNKNWLQAEWQTARTSAKMAEKWNKIDARKHILPWLEYKTQDDDAVRHDHMLLHGTMKKVDDEFWDTYYPPNGWRCRCYVLQHATGEDKDPAGYPDEKAMPPAFKNNPGKSGKIFDENHPYFLENKKDKAKIFFEMQNCLQDEALYDIEYVNKSGKMVKSHLTHIGNEKIDNLKLAKALCDKLSKNVTLLEQANTTGRRYVDMKVEDEFIVEAKNPTTTNLLNIRRNSIGGALSQHKNSKHKDLPLYISIENPNIKYKDLKNFLSNELAKNKNLSIKAFILYNEGNIEFIER